MKSTTTSLRPVNIKSEAISIGVSIWRWIFQKYFTPTAFKIFDRDHKIDDILKVLFWENPQAIKLLAEEWTQLQTDITRRNTTAVLLWKPRVDFEAYIAEELWGQDSPAYDVFKIFLDRMEWFESQEKEKIFSKIKEDQKLDEDEYLFILELFAFERCDFREFKKLYKFIRNTQYEWRLIIAWLKSMKNERFKRWLIQLIENQWTDEERERLLWFL